MTGHSNSHVNSVCISKDCKNGLSGGDDKTLKYWDLSSGNCIRTLTGHKDEIRSVTISSDGLYGLSGSNDKTIKYWRLK